MRSHTDAQQMLTDVAQNLQDQMDQKGARPNVFISKSRMQTFNEYAFLFATNLNLIIDRYDLTQRDIRVILKLIEYMYFGNLLSFSNTKLAADLKIDPSNLSKILKKLKKTELIVEDEGNLYFNPHIACKGFLNENEAKDRQIIDYSAIVLDSYDSPATPSIGTPNIRKHYKEHNDKLSEKAQEKINEFFNK